MIQHKPDTLAALFNDQNCKLTLDDSGDLFITYLDGNAYGIRRRLKRMFKTLNGLDYWQVPWWNNRAIRINGEDHSALINSPEISN